MKVGQKTYLRKRILLLITIIILIAGVFYLNKILNSTNLDFHSKAFSTKSNAFENIVTLLEDVRISNGYRYGAKDNKGNGLDTLKIIQPKNTKKYFGVYHNLSNNRFTLKIGESQDLLNWNFLTDIDSNASQGDLIEIGKGKFLVVYEKDDSQKSWIRLRLYNNLQDLINSKHSTQKDLSFTLSENHEGTPNIISVQNPLSINRNSYPENLVINLGFHYYDINSNTDKNAVGTFTNLTNWTTKTNSFINKYFHDHSYMGNYGDRDRFIYIDTKADKEMGRKEYYVYEAQIVRNRWETWRSFLYDPMNKRVQQLDIYTHKRSISFGNPSVSAIKLPNGQDGLFVSYFIFDEGSVSGESGPLIFFTQKTNLSKATPKELREKHNTNLFPATCQCLNPGSGTPKNKFVCSDDDIRYCASDEVCLGSSIKPVWPCSK